MNRILALREGGQTQRCHTMQYHGAYNVAMHTHNMMTLLLELWPKNSVPSYNLIKACQFHDVAERWMGDIPTTAKLADYKLKLAMNALEDKVLEALGIGDIYINLTETEAEWLDAIDLLELFMWAHDQYKLGNAIVGNMILQIRKIFESNWEEYPIEVQNFIENYQWERSPECRELINDRK